jgi:hypothetical protein
MIAAIDIDGCCCCCCTDVLVSFSNIGRIFIFLFLYTRTLIFDLLGGTLLLELVERRIRQVESVLEIMHA